MQKNALVSIIVPNYNHEQFLEERLNSILNQSFQNIDLILLDDCSTDNSRKILSKYAQHPKVSNVVYNERNSGNTFLQWKKGISLAKGEIIWIAESDDYSSPKFLETLVDKFNSDAKVALVYCQSFKVNSQGEILESWLNYTRNLDSEMFQKDFVCEGKKFIELFLSQKNVIPNASGVIFRKDLYHKVGGVDTDLQLRHCSDWLLYIKLLKDNKVAFISRELNFFRTHEKSVISSTGANGNFISLLEDNQLLFEKASDFLKNNKSGTFSPARMALKKTWRFYQYRKGMYYLKSDQKIRGCVTLIPVLDFLVKNSRIFRAIRHRLLKSFQT